MKHWQTTANNCKTAFRFLCPVPKIPRIAFGFSSLASVSKLLFDYSNTVIDVTTVNLAVDYCNRVPYRWRGGLVVGRRTCDLVVAGSSPGRDAAA